MSRRKFVPVSSAGPGPLPPNVTLLPRGWTKDMILAEERVMRKLASLSRGTGNDCIGSVAQFERKLDELWDLFSEFKTARIRAARRPR